jgi:hypothetical protein
MAKRILESGNRKFIFNFLFSPAPITTLPKSKSTSRDKGNQSNEDDDEEQIELDGTERFPYVDIEVYRKDFPKLRFKWAGFLNHQTKIPFFVPLPVIDPEPAPVIKKGVAVNKNLPPQTSGKNKEKKDVNFCEGEFSLYQNSYTGQRFVWFTIQFGDNYERSYGGAMIQIPLNDNLIDNE